MKRIKSILSIFLILFLFSGTSYAAGNKTINVAVSGKNVSVTQVPIIKDGQTIDMEFPSFVYIDRTLVPVRFVAENLGAEVGWDQKTQTAIVNYKGKRIDLTIDSDMAKINGESKKLDNNSIPRLVKFKDENARTMVPLAFVSEMLGYDVGWDNGANAAFINTRQEQEPAPKPEQTPESKPEVKPDPKPEIESLNQVQQVKKETIDGKDAIVIYGTKKVEEKVMKLKNPERIVIDLLDSNLQGSTYYNFDYDLGFIKGVRVSQFSPDGNYKPTDKIVRVVLDTKDGSMNPEVKIGNSGDKIIIFPEKNFWDNINYHVEGMGRTLTINNLIETSYSLDYNPANKRMEIAIPKYAVNLTEGSLSIKDNLVDHIKITETGSDMKVILQFTKDVEYNLLSNNIDSKVVLQVKGKSDQKPKDRLIVIDPGHGGAQPGTTSINGLKEKDLNLDISLKTEKALKSAGYNVMMTRTKDETLGLSARPAIANENFADIFISIHGNSFTNDSVNGIEVWYVPSDSGSEKEKGQVKLAKSIQDELIKATGANNRGVKKSTSLVVLKQSKMPAVLIEVGFLSNAKEEGLIANESYQNKIADAIVKGVEKYFESY